MEKILEVRDLKASVVEDGNVILKGVNLTINSGEIHAIMGPNGSGKSTLANVIMGSPKYEVLEGDILFKGQSILDLSTDERAKLGLFMSFQAPEEVDGVKMRQFLLNSYRNINENDSISALKLSRKIDELSDTVYLDKLFLDRYVNNGFSGGEKKKSEIMQMGLLNPKLAILDEIDSGLDIDALRIVAESINKFKTENMGILLITHYQRILNYVIPDFVHVYSQGHVITTGGAELAKEIEENGYSMIEG
ncbi:MULTISPECIES: Fe-S cluster assembly ATPase SufC [Oceanotoga]|jgi:Fe-S cluster assembly ATP-binding protein|uniref:Fe-S cluster assembly ATP-binding protein n=1 Tax=Oceanotoga teriensis TaxID=515440 RepID=A0AA45HIH9_9BACT|nr:MULTISPECIES: Fe-S cluster assembly ATPase SufC [Oceanotoga]MDN5343530.1 Fe-S cluster assembly ATP-binding protein [Oceanotoga sp.]MDO7977541.1 Fe-S cluster assembly ATPase SufC [Oceanotoga teriensis]PWJ91239.1 Fe-S cluster assembly ATP-binding protein [Oceanotoga teriensis]